MGAALCVRQSNFLGQSRNIVRSSQQAKMKK